MIVLIIWIIGMGNGHHGFLAYALGVSDLLHVLYNGIKEAIEEVREWKGMAYLAELLQDWKAELLNGYKTIRGTRSIMLDLMELKGLERRLKVVRIVAFERPYQNPR